MAASVGKGAFPGDTYIADLTLAAKTKRSWVLPLIGIILLSAIADIGILAKIIAVNFDYDEADPMIWFLAAVIAFCYIGIGLTAGNKAREACAFGRRTSWILFIVAFVAEVAVLFLIAWLRYRMQIESDDLKLLANGAASSSFSGGSEEVSASNDSASPKVLHETIFLAIIMFLGAFLSVVVAYYRTDAVTEEKARRAKAALPEDAALYSRVYFEIAANDKKDREYEAEECRLDERAVESAFRLSSLASQLNGILDPADAHDFRQMSRQATSSYYRESNSSS